MNIDKYIRKTLKILKIKKDTRCLYCNNITNSDVYISTYNIGNMKNNRAYFCNETCKDNWIDYQICKQVKKDVV